MDLVVKNTLNGMKILKKPMYVILGAGDSIESEALHQEARQKYNAAGITTFPSFQLAARIMSKLSLYRKYLGKKAE